LTLLRYRRLPAPGAGQLGLLLVPAFSGVFLFNIFYFSGLRRVTASRGSVIMALSPGMVAVGSFLFYHRKLGFRQVAGLLLALAGTVWVITAGRPLALLQGAVGPGELCLAGSMLCWTVYSLVGKTVLKKLTPLLAGAAAVVAGISLTSRGLSGGPGQSAFGSESEA
jgi:drug/metabolite transporter (DMT)-like permease